MASPTRRAPPAPLRPPARLGAARRRSERSPVRAASAPPPPGPPRPLLAPPPPRDGSASPFPSHRARGCTKIKKKKNPFSFLSFFFVVGRAGMLRLLGLLPPARTHLRSRREGWGVGARGAGAGERGLKASQALQRPTRACTPPPVPAEKSSSYPRLHRSAFLFQSAGRLAAPPFSGQARCLERAPLHLLAWLLAPLPGPARRRGAGGGFAREPA